MLTEIRMLPSVDSYAASATMRTDTGSLRERTGSFPRSQSNAASLCVPKDSKSGAGGDVAAQLRRSEQENLLIKDLLSVLAGMDGVHILATPPLRPRKSNAGPKGQFPPGGLSYSIDPEIDASLATFAARILPMAKYYTAIQSYIDSRSDYSHGRVSQAIAASMSVLLKEYFILIGQLERRHESDPAFSLQQVWFHLDPTLATMKRLASLTEALRSAESDRKPEAGEERQARAEDPRGPGGYLLTVIATFVEGQSGGASSRALYLHLLKAGAAPFFEVLRNWIHQGDLIDPHGEFMVLENRKHSKSTLRNDVLDAYWSQRYVIRDGAVPPFLEKWAEKILAAGKYWNVVKECGGNVVKRGVGAFDDPGIALSEKVHADDILSAIGGFGLPEEIDSAYMSANRILLGRLMSEERLLDRIRSIKHFFLLDQSDFVTHFFDLAASELAKQASEVSVSRLQNLFDLSIRNPAGVGANDPFRDDLRVELCKTTLVDMVLTISMIRGESTDSERTRQLERIKQHRWANVEAVRQPTLTGLDAFNLSLTTKFPVSLVLNLRTLTMYQFLFRHLMLCKHVERTLSLLWSEQIASERVIASGERRRNGDTDAPVNDSGRANDQVSARFKTRTYTLRAQMLDFVRQVLYYICFEVIEPNWLSIEEDLQKVTTVDQLLKKHEDFLETCLKESMLTQDSLLKIFNTLTLTVVSFCNFAEWWNRNRRQTAAVAAEHELGPQTYLFPEYLTLPPSTSTTFNRTLTSQYSDVATLKKFEATFVWHLQLLVEALRFFAATEASRLGGLASRLDWNAFYARGGV